MFTERQYHATDEVYRVSPRPDFHILAYTAGVVDLESLRMHDYIRVSPTTPPTFLAHASDDFVPVPNPMQLSLELSRHGVPAELYVYSEGGHGYGLRETTLPVTTWHHRCADWMRVMSLLTRP